MGEVSRYAEPSQNHTLHHDVQWPGDIHRNLSVFSSWGGCHGLRCHHWRKDFTAKERALAGLVYFHLAGSSVYLHIRLYFDNIDRHLMH